MCLASNPPPGGSSSGASRRTLLGGETPGGVGFNSATEGSAGQGFNGQNFKTPPDRRATLLTAIPMPPPPAFGELDASPEAPPSAVPAFAPPNTLGAVPIPKAPKPTTPKSALLPPTTMSTDLSVPSRLSGLSAIAPDLTRQPVPTASKPASQKQPGADIAVPREDALARPGGDEPAISHQARDGLGSGGTDLEAFDVPEAPFVPLDPAPKFAADFGVDDAPGDGGGEQAFGGALELDVRNELLAIQQGTSPVVRRLDGSLNYEPAKGRAQSFFEETGQLLDPRATVALYDPATGRVTVFRRNPDMGESGAARFGRLLGLGVVTGSGRQAVKYAVVGAKASAQSVRLLDANRRFAGWASELLQGKRFAKGEMVRVGRLSDDVQDFIRAKGIDPAVADISVTDKRLVRMVRDLKAEKGIAVPDEMIGRMPEVMAKPKAVLWDKRNRNLLYVFDVHKDPRKGKFVIKVNFDEKVSGRGKVTTNSVRSGGMVALRNLSDTNLFTTVKGRL